MNDIYEHNGVSYQEAPELKAATKSTVGCTGCAFDSGQRGCGRPPEFPTGCGLRRTIWLKAGPAPDPAIPAYGVPTGSVPRVVMAVGDINSTAKGSGARANGGKPDFSLVDLQALAVAMAHGRPDSIIPDVLHLLGRFQATHDDGYLFRADYCLGGTWEECCEVLTYGTGKYAAWNWAKGMPWSVPLACAVRHLLAMHRGEELDPESGKPHRGHVRANLLMLMTFIRTYPEGNDLPPKGLLA